MLGVGAIACGVQVALLVSEKRTADVYTTQPSLLMEITQEDLHNVLQPHSASAEALYGTLRKISELRVRRNGGELEQHPSVINGGNASMLSGKCSVKGSPCPAALLSSKRDVEV